MLGSFGDAGRPQSPSQTRGNEVGEASRETWDAGKASETPGDLAGAVPTWFSHL